jgi:hypothetical protein
MNGRADERSSSRTGADIDVAGLAEAGCRKSPLSRGVANRPGCVGSTRTKNRVRGAPSIPLAGSTIDRALSLLLIRRVTMVSLKLPGSQKRQRGCVVCLIALLSAGWPTAARAGEPTIADRTHVAAVPIFPVEKAVLAFARAHAIDVSTIEPSVAGDGKAGDTVLAVATLRTKGKTRQWLMELRMDDLTPKERAGAGHMIMTVDIKSHRYQFVANESMAIAARTIGPFEPTTTTAPDDKHGRALVSGDFLALGLDKACRQMIDNGKDNAALSEAGERAVVGVFPALGGFFQAVQNTPGLRDILWEVIEKPSVWSFAKTGGHLNVFMNYGDAAAVKPEEWSFAGNRVWRFDLALSLNKKPALDCVLFVVSPKPPLLTTGGVVRIIAVPPTRPDTELEIRVLSTRRAASTQGN